MFSVKLSTWAILSSSIIFVVHITGLHRKDSPVWPLSKVYFDVDPQLPKEYRDVIRYAILYMNSKSCVKWEQRLPWKDDVPNYVSFTYYEDDSFFAPACKASIGFLGGKQRLVLGKWCFKSQRELWRKRYTVIHQMMHTLGFYHEHQRPDRNCYIRINPPGESFTNAYRTFMYAPLNYSSLVDDFPYDYFSVTHYDGSIGMTALNKSIGKVGRSDLNLSPTDIKKIEALYCGGNSFCGDPDNVQACRDIWADKVSRGCSSWTGWTTNLNIHI